MNKNNYNVIGVMSGTSLDGIDLLHVHFSFSGAWKFEIKAAETLSYSETWRNKLSAAVNFSSEDLTVLNREYTAHLGMVISQFIEKHAIKNLDAVCSHGHTVKHEPQNRFTLQIGNLPFLAQFLKTPVVCDFRVQDVAMGGQGAPLVPIGDQILFKDYDYCVNLGGFANVSFQKNKQRIAYDICAVNTILNYLAGKIGLEYDAGGARAAAGKPDYQLLEKLDKMPFYELQPPKSLGIEWVHQNIIPFFENYENTNDALHTYCVHAGAQIGANLGTGKAIITGGGAFNDFLMSQIEKNTAAEVILPASEIINYKEALIFAFLGVLKLRDEVNVLSSVTGASKDHSSGKIYHYS